MVQKISKRGVYSGNTLRASNSRFNRRYSRTSGLLRKSINHNSVKTTILDDMNMTHDNVIYSLSKKGRWELPELLKRSILAGDYKDSKSNIKLVVSHNIIKKSHTIGYYASKGKTKKVESKLKKYFNGESVAAKGRQEDASETVGEKPVLQIEVVYPSPMTCSVVHNPKYVGHCTDKPESGKARTARTRTSKAKRQRQRLAVGKYCEELNEAFGDFINDSDESEIEIDEEAASYIYGNCKEETSTCIELLEDIMVHAALMQSLCETRNQNKKLVSCPKLETKEKKIYEYRKTETETEEIEDEIFQGIPVLSPGKRMDPVFVLLPKKEVECKLLAERYGNKYSECACIPRKFLIDVSDRMRTRTKTSGCLKGEYTGTWDLTSCVVFSRDEYDANNTDTLEVYRVCLNMATNAEIFRILTLFDYFEGSVEDVLHRAVVFLDMVSTDGFIEIETEPPKDVMPWKFEKLNKSQKFEKEVTFISRQMLYKEIFNQKCYENENIAGSLEFECVSSDFCGVCFDVITEGGKAGTALVSCGHWFCDECWGEHCRSRMNMGSVHISCPEHGCSEMVPESVLLTFINVFEVLNLKRRAHDIELNSSENAKWCPNPKCSRVIKVSNPDKAKDVACFCGTQICFQCLQPSHWPVPCDNAILYWKKLTRLGDDYLKMATKVTVRGKQCPKCKRFVEKLGGCFYMSCACGANFCWGCLGLYPNHVHSEKCIQYKNGDLKGTSTIAVTDLDAYLRILNDQKSSDYKKAVYHRKSRHPMQVHKMKACVRDINFRCKNIAKRKGPLYFSMFSGEIPVEEKIQDLFSNMLSIYVELHHIAEYSYVLLEKLDRVNKKCAQFRSSVESLGFYADVIFELLSNSGNLKDFRPLITSLLHIQHKAAYLTKETVQFTNKLAL